VGGIAKSLHMDGGGADGVADNVNPQTIMNIAKETTILSYTYQCGTWEVHTDTKL
jgi:hypothetical protein